MGYSYIPSRGLWLMVWLDGQEFGRNMIGMLRSRESEKEVGGQTSLNVHQRVALKEDYFNKQVDRMTCSIDNSQPLSSASPVITQWAHEQRDQSGRNKGYVWDQQHELPLIKANLLNAQSASRRDEH